jgi:insulysin
MWTPRSAGVERLADRLDKPLLDDGLYRVVNLSHQLEALLIHEGVTDKAAQAMDINAGNFSDAEGVPGIAHAVEHLLLMGTKKV